MRRIPYVKWQEAEYEVDENGEMTFVMGRQYTIGEVIPQYVKILHQLTCHEARLHVERLLWGMRRRDPTLPAIVAIADGGY